MKPLGVFDPPQVGRYWVLAELGRGSMGRVLLGSGPDGRLVAVKQVRAQLTEDEGFRARFRREVDVSRKVSGVYTAAVVDADPDAPIPWLASVFVPGPSLREAVNTAGPLPEASVLRLAAGLAAALTGIHGAGLVHRDLKPSNVLLAEDAPRVIDFGIARAADSESGSEITHTGWLLGSPGFMSPSRPKDSRSPRPATCSPSAPCWPWPALAQARSSGPRPRRRCTTSCTPSPTSARSHKGYVGSSSRVWPRTSPRGPLRPSCWR